jgi:heavy metal sensor kinase
MADLKWLNRVPLRQQLIGWYVFLLAIMLSGFAIYLFLRLERKLIFKVDATLQIASDQSLLYLNRNKTLNFPNSAYQRDTEARLSRLGLAVRLINPQGKVVDGFGRFQDVPPLTDHQKGFETLKTRKTDWRVITQPIIRNGQEIGWLQVAQSLDVLEDITEELPAEILFNLPWFLLVTALGGLFLSNRALRPIQKITRTAQNITANDLSLRIHNQGSMDEVGQLAKTFDQMLDRLQAAFEREKRFTADAAHELRTPLTAIKVRLDVTRSQPRSAQEYDHMLQDLEHEVDRLIRLSNGLLLLTKLDHGQLPCTLQTVNLSNLLEILIEQITPLAEVQHLKLLNELPKWLWVKGDTDHLTSLFLNLLDNAVKYTPHGGRVRLWVPASDLSKDSKDSVEINISNTGPGISPEHLPHLFERFYQAEAARSRGRSGTGLGLAIAHEIARLHHGTLRAYSNPNQETTFSVSLPLSGPLFGE